MNTLSRRILLVAAALLLGLPLAARAADEYVLGPEDVLQIRVARHQELDIEVSVLTDGSVSVPRGGSVMVQGLTVPQAQEKVAEALKAVLVNPQVTISVKVPRPNRVRVTGLVNRPGTFDLKPGERVMDVLAEAGGLRGKPELAHCTIFRKGGVMVPVDLVALHIKRDPAANLELQPLDVVDVQEEATNRIYVSGRAVKAPGQFDLTEGLGVVEALAMAGGLLVKPEVGRATLFHKDGTTEKVDLVAIHNTQDPSANLKLKPGDILDVQERPTSRIYVNGQGVRTPGEFDVETGLTVVQALAKAGGFTPNAALRKAHIERAPKDGQPQEVIPVDLYDAVQKGEKGPDLMLEAGDTLVVPEIAARVSIFGMVRAAGSYPMPEVDAFGVSDAIGLAGGEIKRANLKSVRVVRRQGAGTQPKVIKVNVAKFRKNGDMSQNIALLDGDTIVVPETGRPDFFGRIVPAITSLGTFGYYMGFRP
ncbi:MAG TPA: SLBB domain-containing protein [Armatimonadota bacterium]|jgi:polysaccharide export outer membrane protein